MSATQKVYTALPFAPRPWQRPLIEDRSRNIVAVVHRRAGKSTAFIWRGLRTATSEERKHIPEARRNLKVDPPRVVHVLPAQVMWQRTGLWDKVARAAEMIPGAVPWKSVLRVELPNGGVYQCGGMDTPDSWRGGSAEGGKDHPAVLVHEQSCFDGAAELLQGLLQGAAGTACWWQLTRYADDCAPRRREEEALM